MLRFTITSVAVAALTLCCQFQGAPPRADASACVVSGCSGQLCIAADADPVITTCEYREEYACYESAQCSVQDNGACGWTRTPELVACLTAASANSGPEPSSSGSATPETTGAESQPSEPGCVRGGCSGQLCVSADAEPLVTTCEWRPEYACYADADCEIQADGLCGWSKTDALVTCLNEATASP